jgi:hypothetical protein
MNIETELENQIAVSSWIDQNLAVAYSFDSENESWSHSCFDLVVEHHAAIISLSKIQLHGAAFALLRVEFEALVRGLWLKHVASIKEINRFKKDKVDPTFNELIKAIESTVGISSGLLSYIKDTQWSIFNSFTHTGVEALSRRVGKKTTGYDNYHETDVVKALRFSGLVAIFAAVELASLTKDQDIIKNSLELARNYGE